MDLFENPARTRCNILAGLVLAFTIFIFSACVTSVPIQVQRPPEMDVVGIRRIAVMPFEMLLHDTIYWEAAQYATNTATAKIRELNQFTLVDPREIERLRRSGRALEDYVDALFSGQITRINVNESASQTLQTRNGQEYTITTYTTTVDMEFNYSFTRAYDRSLIGPVIKSGSKSSSSQNGYPSAAELCASFIDEQFAGLRQALVPHTVTQYRTLSREKSDDKELKALMKDALALVKAGNYSAALDSYLLIYSTHQSIAAAENAAILYEALGSTETAAALIRQVVEETGSPSARNALSRLDRVLRDQAAAAAASEKLSVSGGRTELVINYASGEIRKVLPANARVWIVNAVRANATTVALADNLTADFIRRGIATVDRQSRRLIEAEQNFQVSGNVADDDFVSIGNAVGANTIITLGISGTGAMRRLQVRVVDIGRGVLLMQSDTGDNWRL